jgi:signal transduction histidine kinase
MFPPVYMLRLVALGAAIYLVALAFAASFIGQHGGTRRAIGWTCSTPGESSRVVSIVQDGPAAGSLQLGDRILAIDGQSKFAGWYLPSTALWNYPTDVRYRMRIERHGEIHEVNLQILAKPEPGTWPFVWAYLFGSLTFLATGILMGWKRPALATAQWGWLACQLTALVYINLAWSASGSLSWPASLPHSLLVALGDWHYLAVYYFLATFPVVRPENRLWGAIRLVVIALCALDGIAWMAIAAADILSALGHPNVWAVAPLWWFAARASVNSLFLSTFTLCAAGVIVRNYRQSDPADRRRVEIVAGSILGGVLVNAIGSVYVNATAAPTFIHLLANLAPLPIPVCFYYAVMKHQVFDIRLVIRRGLQYLLAKQALRALTMLPLAGIAILALRHPGAPIASTVNLGGVALIAAAGLCLEFRQRILASVDRWFFRESIDSAKLLRCLLGEIARLGSYEEIVEIVERRLTEIFAPASVSIADASAPVPESALSIPIRSPAGQIESRLLLGPKKSEEPYTASERELLELVGTQVGLVRENLLLAAERFDAVLSERTRIARELHDTMSQGFAGISLYLEAARKSMTVSPEKTGEYLEAARTLAKTSIQETRDSVRGLRASAEDSSLEKRLRALAARPAAGPAVSVEMQAGAGSLASADAGWHLARVAEEAVTNAFKHSRANRITVNLTTEGAHLVLRVRDDGEGFDPASIRTRGYGLLGMRERIGQMQGSMEIVSAPGRGTEVRAAVLAKAAATS